MKDRDDDFSFLQGIHVRTDSGTDFSIYIRPMRPNSANMYIKNSWLKWD